MREDERMNELGREFREWVAARKVGGLYGDGA